MKYAAVAVLLIVIQAPLPAPRETASPQDDFHKDSKNTSTTHKPPSTSVPIKNPIAPGNPNKDTQASTTKDEPNNSVVTVNPVSVQKDRLDKIYIASTLLIAIATLVLARIAWIQANAAKASAEATVNAERAWLLPVMAQQVLQSIEPGNDLRLCAIACKVINYGKTPARVFESVLKLHILNPGEKLAARPDYRGAEGQTPNPIPGEFVLPTDKDFTQIVFTVPAKIAEIKTKKLTLYIYGFVRYYHVFSMKPARTAFCFLYHVPAGFDLMPEGFYSGGPEAYRETT